MLKALKHFMPFQKPQKLEPQSTFLWSLIRLNENPSNTLSVSATLSFSLTTSETRELQHCE